MRVQASTKSSFLNSKENHIGLLDFHTWDSESFTYQSSQSLLDYDLVLWNIKNLPNNYSNISQIPPDKVRRNSDIKTFVQNGGLLVVFLGEPKYFDFYNGREELSSFIPGCPGTSLSEGTKIDLRSSHPKLKQLWEKISPSFVYKSIIRLPVQSGLATVRNTDNVVSYQSFIGKGSILVLPSLTEYPSDGNPESKKRFSEIVKHIEDFKRSEKDLPIQIAPAWVHSIKLPGEKEVESEISDISLKIESLNKEIQEKQKELEGFSEDKRLLFSTGEALELQVMKALQELGMNAVPGKEGRDDLILSYKDKKGVVEIKGIKGSAAERHAAQLEKWASNYLIENELQAKPFLIINAFNEIAPELRKEPAFPSQMQSFCAPRNHCLITTTQLLDLVLACRQDPSKKDIICDNLFSTNGVFI